MKKMLGIMLTMLVLATAPAMAADVKIGVIDLQQALNSTQEGKAAKDRIKRKVDNFQKTMESRQAELKKLNDDFEKQKMVLSADARAAKEREYQQKVRAFQLFAKDAQEELQQEDAKATRHILEGLSKIVKEIGDKGGYTVIVEKNSLLYANNGIDLTNQVIQAYDKLPKKANGK